MAPLSGLIRSALFLIFFVEQSIFALHMIYALQLSKETISRDQLMKNHVGRALRTLKSFPTFPEEFRVFVQDEACRESEGILCDKDPPRITFSLDSLRKFSYKEQLAKLQETSPILVAAVTGTISRQKVVKDENITRKGFGGPKSDQDIDLIPAVVQTVTRVIKNAPCRLILASQFLLK